jgi:AraC family transcriptional regulator of arabinose operon
LNDAVFPITGSERNLPFYLIDAGGHENQPHIRRPSGFPSFQVIYCTRGKGMLKFNGLEYTIQEKMGFIMYPNIIHEYKPLDEPWETHWIAFDGTSAAELMTALGFDHSGLIYLTDIFALDHFLEQILIKSKSKYILKGYAYSALLYSFLIELKNSASYLQTIQKEYKLNQIQPVLSYIETNFNKMITLEELADTISVSPQYLCRLFKTCLDMRPFTYLTQRRISESKKLLLETDFSIQDISAKVGFNSSNYFCSSFRQFEKMSPDEFRKLHR